MKIYTITSEQILFLKWVTRNYEFLKHKGFKEPTQPFQHWVYGLLMGGTYTRNDRSIINYTIGFLRGIGMTTYKKDWEWDKNGAELDWIVNVS